MMGLGGNDRGGRIRLALALYALGVAVALPARGDDARARQLYTNGEAAFSGGRYGDAARAFEQAFAESRHPSLLWNCAQSYRKQFDIDHDVTVLRRAQAVYRNYLELLPPGADRAEADAALAAVAKQIEAAEKGALAAPAEPARQTPPLSPAVLSPAPPVAHAAPPAALPSALTEPPPPDSPPRARRKGLWIGLGVGGALVVGAVAIALGVTYGSSTVQDGLAPGNLAPGLATISP